MWDGKGKRTMTLRAEEVNGSEQRDSENSLQSLCGKHAAPVVEMDDIRANMPGLVVGDNFARHPFAYVAYAVDAGRPRVTDLTHGKERDCQRAVTQNLR